MPLIWTSLKCCRLTELIQQKSSKSKGSKYGPLPGRKLTLSKIFRPRSVCTAFAGWPESIIYANALSPFFTQCGSYMWSNFSVANDHCILSCRYSDKRE